MRFVARLFFFVFTVFVIGLLVNGGYKYSTMGHERFISVEANPVKYYFALIWHSFVICLSFYFGFIAKLKSITDKENEVKRNKKKNLDK